MNKFYKILLSVFVCAFVFLGGISLAGCNNKYSGEYVVTLYTDSEINVEREKYEENPSEYDEWDIAGWFEMTIKLKSNGKFEQHQENDDFVQKGEWEVYGDKMKLVVDGELYMEFTILNDTAFTYKPYAEYSDEITTLTLSKI